MTTNLLGSTRTGAAPAGTGRPAPRAVGDLLRAAAGDHPSHGVVYTSADPGSSHRRSYPQLWDDAAAALRGLRAAGVTPYTVVGLLIEEPAEFLPVLWACLLGGFTACPLVPMRTDPERWAAHLRHVDELFDGPVLVVGSGVAADLPDVSSRVLPVQDLHAAAGAARDEFPDVDPEHPAVLVLTSGSTGNAKAVVLTHANLLASMAAKAHVQQLGADDVTLNWISYDHVAALLEAHLLPLSVGADQVQTRPEPVLGDPLLFLELVDRHRVTMTFTPNFLLGLINDLLAAGDRPSFDLSCLRHIVSGGEANPVATGHEFLTGLAACGLRPDALWPAFGMTETCAGSIYNTDFPTGDAAAEFASVGRPVRGLRIRIVAGPGGADAEVVPDGQVGELQLTGPMITGGYHHNPAATEAAFTADGWFRTGDLGVVDDGRLTLVGRLKDSVIVNGVNYYSHEIETGLQDLDGVDRSYVAAFPTRPSGSQTEQLAVAFATSVDDEVELFRLLSAVRENVVLHWGFRPSVVLPLAREQFPKTSLGKIQRATMRTRLEGGDYRERQDAVAEIVARQLGGYEPPEGPVETALTEIYGELFGLEPSEVGVTASFFDLGGTSLDILRLKNLVAARFADVQLPVLALLTAPRIRDLARRVEAGPDDRVSYDPVVALHSGGDRTPLFCVHPGVGEVLVFVNLAKYFVRERPFLALRARGFNPGEAPFGSFDEMVDTYVEAIRRRQPHGPYALAGYSFGAAVAFEIAKRLQADGEQVPFLGSFNLPPHIKYRMDELDYVETAVNLAMFLGLVGKGDVDSLADRLRPLPVDEQLAALLALAPAGRLEELDLTPERFRTWADLANGLTGLGRTYEPGGAVDDLTVFYATPLRGTKQDWLEHELRRWDEHVRHEVTYLDVPGEHYTLMDAEHVERFQAVLRAELARRLPEGEGPA